MKKIDCKYKITLSVILETIVRMNTGRSLPGSVLDIFYKAVIMQAGQPFDSGGHLQHPPSPIKVTNTIT